MAHASPAMPRYKQLLCCVSILLAAPVALAGDSTQATLQALLGSRWKGEFGQAGAKLPISLKFQRTLSAKGELLYFHYLDGGAVESKALGSVDKACAFTPRALLLAPTSPVSGTISVFPCAKSEAEEANLAADANRKPLVSLPVKSVELSPDGGTLHIVVQMGLVPVDYQLTRQATPPESAQPADAATATAE